MKQTIKYTVGLWLVAVVPVAALFLALLTTPAKDKIPWFQFSVESVVFLLVMLAIASVPPLRALACGLGRRRAVALSALCCALMSGQLLSQSRVTFPFLGWSMYTTLNEDVAVLEFEANYASGKKTPFPFMEVCPTAYPRPFMDRFNIFLPLPEGKAADAAREKISQSLQVLVDRFNAQPQNDPIQSLCLSRSVFQSKLFGQEDWVRREQVLCVEGSQP